MRKALWTLLLLWGSSTFKGLQTSQNGHMELTRLKISLMYVRSIKTFRLLFSEPFGHWCMPRFFIRRPYSFSRFFVLICPMEYGKTKMLLGLFCSVVYLMVTLVIFAM